MNNRKAYLCAASLFLSGMILGAVGLHFMMRFVFLRPHAHDHHSVSKMILSHLNHELNLTPAELDKITPFVENMSHRIHEIRKDARPRIEAILDETKQQVDSILDPDQREKLAQMEQRVKERFAEETD